MNMRLKPTSFVPRTSGGEIDWDELRRRYDFIEHMAETPQCAEHHAEGDVLTHTKMVVDEAEKLAVERQLTQSDRELLIAAAVFHDCGKPSTLTLEGGVPSSPKHAAVGTTILRRIWWERGWYPHALREQVLSLVRYHAAPVRLLDNRHDPEYRVIEMSWMARNDLLPLLAEADMRGRVSRDAAAQQRAVETTRLFADYAGEVGCLTQPKPFSTGLARFHYFATGGKSGASYEPFDDSVGEAVLLCGLPASGKNTWVERNANGIPVVELDSLRREMRIKPEDNQGAIVQAAKERAREFMRRKTPRFVWNATNLRIDLRRPLISLFTEYGYKTRIIFCPADRASILTRNQRRPDSTRVPIDVIDNLARKLEPPLFTESAELEVFSEESAGL